VLAFGLLDLEPKDIEPPARKLLLAPAEIDQLLGERRTRGAGAISPSPMRSATCSNASASRYAIPPREPS
jgi:hypothetical protein